MTSKAVITCRSKDKLIKKLSCSEIAAFFPSPTQGNGNFRTRKFVGWYDQIWLFHNRALHTVGKRASKLQKKYPKIPRLSTYIATIELIVTGIFLFLLPISILPKSVLSSHCAEGAFSSKYGFFYGIEDWLLAYANFNITFCAS